MQFGFFFTMQKNDMEWTNHCYSIISWVIFITINFSMIIISFDTKLKVMIKDFSIFLVPEKRYTRKRFSAYFVMDLFLPKWFSPLNEINLYGCSHQTMSSTNSRGRYGVICIFWRTNKPVALTIINLLMRESTIRHLLYHIYIVDIYIALRVMLVYQIEEKWNYYFRRIS